MQISSIKNYSVSNTQNFKKNNIVFQQAPVNKALKNVMSNPESKKIFIKLAEVLGLSAIIAGVSHFGKNNNEDINKALTEVEEISEAKCSEFLLDIDTMDKYLELSASSDEIDSILTTIGKQNSGLKLDVSTSEIKEESLMLLSNPATRDTYLESRRENAIKSLTKQTETILKATDEQRENFIKSLECKISNLANQIQELSANENLKEIMAKIKNIAKLQSIITFMQNISPKSEVKPEENITEVITDIPVEVLVDSDILENVKSESDDVLANEVVDATTNETKPGVKVVGQIDLTVLEAMKGGRKSAERTAKKELAYEPQEVVVTPRNKKFVDAFNFTYKNKNGAFPIEAYGNKLDFIKEIYDSYGRKDKVKDALLNLLVKENMNQMLDKYKSMLRLDKNNLDFINFVKLEKLKATEKGSLSKEEFDKISDYKDVVIKYLYALPEDGRLTLSFKENVTVAERLQYIVDFHKMIFNVQDQASVDDFSEPIQMGDVKAELIKRLVEDPSDYSNIREYLGIDDVSEIIIQLNAGDKEEAEAVAEDLLMQPEVEDNIHRLINLLNNEKFTGFFASTHSRMRLIERYIMNNFETINYDNIGNPKEKEKAIRKLDKDLSKGILTAISTLKKEIQRIEEIDIYNYKMGNVQYKSRYSSFPRIKVYDNVIGLNDKGQIHTIFINENFS